MYLREKHIALGLRKKGLTYGEIRNILPRISKSTLSIWLSRMTLTASQAHRIKINSQRKLKSGILRAAITNRSRKEKRMVETIVQAQKIFKIMHSDTFFVAGVMLYWAEGAKTSERVQFMNSDPYIISMMINWFQKYLGIKKSRIKVRLFTHHMYKHEKHEEFWKNNLDLPVHQFHKTILKPTPHIIKKNPSYRGCLRIDAGGVKEFRMIKCWQKEFTRKFCQAPVV